MRVFRGARAGRGGSWRLLAAPGRPKARVRPGGAWQERPTEMRRHAFCGARPPGAPGGLAVRCGGGQWGAVESRRCGVMHYDDKIIHSAETGAYNSMLQTHAWAAS